MATQRIGTRVLAASGDRDRVLDTVKAVALLLVIVGHSLAWHTPGDGTAINVLEVAPWLIPLTWVFQVLPLFFAAGAVSNAASLARYDRRAYLSSRGRRLLAPVLVYATLWTAVLIPFAGSSTVAGAGRFLAQLLWFAGVYLLVAAAAVFTIKWANRPWLTLVAWFLLIVAVDTVRTTPWAAWGWINMLLVWGWLHQVGYHLPAAAGAALGGSCRRGTDRSLGGGGLRGSVLPLADLRGGPAGAVQPGTPEHRPGDLRRRPDPADRGAVAVAAAPARQ